MKKVLRACADLIFNVTLAVFGTGFAVGVIAYVFHPRTIVVVLLKALIGSAVFAFLLGLGVKKTFESSMMASKVWIVTSIWLLLRITMLYSATPDIRFVAQQLVGQGCVVDKDLTNCELNFFLSSIPFVRGVAYSLGARLAVITGSSLKNNKRLPGN